MRYQTLKIAAACTLVLAVAIPAAAKGVAIGEAVPDFTLTDYTGKTHTLAELKGKIVVLAFLSHNCPYSRGTNANIGEVAAKYADKGVVVIGIDSDKTNNAEDVKKYAEDKGLKYAIVKDPQNDYADLLAASRTPEIYIVDKDGKLAFHGAFDDRKVPERAGEKNYVANALDALLAGQPVAEPKVSAWGCTIKRVSPAEKSSD